MLAAVGVFYGVDRIGEEMVYEYMSILIIPSEKMNCMFRDCRSMFHRKN